MSALSFLLTLSLVSASVPSPRTPLTPGQVAAVAVDPAPTGSPRLARRGEHLVISGTVALLLGGFAWGWMFGGLLFGARARRDHDGLVDAVNAADRRPDPGEQRRLADYDQEGSRHNTEAIAGASVGAALTLLGAVLLGRGLVLRKRQTRLAPLALGATWSLKF